PLSLHDALPISGVQDLDGHARSVGARYRERVALRTLSPAGGEERHARDQDPTSAFQKSTVSGRSRQWPSMTRAMRRAATSSRTASRSAGTRATSAARRG